MIDKKEPVNLDDPEVYRRFDPFAMLLHLHLFPDLCEKAWQSALGFKLPEDYHHVNKILILGMGGSAIGGDLVASLAVNEATVPVMVGRDYYVPQYVDEDTLVIASSYSGMTEETLSAFEQTFETPAKKLAITTGGKLQSLCDTLETPVFTFDYAAQPRAALPFSLFILLAILHNLGFVKDAPQALPEVLSLLARISAEINETVPLNINPAKSLARKLYGRLPVIYGGGITTEVAHRWKTQINENSKTTAFYEVFSELNHNAVVGYTFPAAVLPQMLVIMLDSDLLHERLRLRYSITRELLAGAGIDCEMIKGEGTSALGQMMSLIYLGDYVSYYLALLNETDPTTIKEIDFLKGRLAQS